MAPGVGSVAAGFLAGVLSTLSPCVLPLLPMVVGGALSAHRWGALALAAGLALSFTAVGLFVATIGFAAGMDGDVFRTVSAVVLGGVGVVLLSSRLQGRVAEAGAGFADASNRIGSRILGRMAPSGWGAQMAIGVMLGAVWSPCVGPTLGAASILAAQGSSLPAVAAVMLAFGIGAGMPLVVVSALSRRAILRWRGRMVRVGGAGKLVMGGGALGVAVLILTGLDRHVEAALVAVSPAWLTDLTTFF